METLIVLAVAALAILGTYLIATRMRPASRELRSQEGALSTEYVLLMGVGAVIIIALGIFVAQNLMDRTTDIDLEYEQVRPTP
jgi:Flp pilus assembly pilin Flp